MYEVVVIDDEWWTLQGILKTFKFTKKGFEVVISTTDSKKALKYILNNKVDVVFTDVRMPECSGIELLEKARKNKIKAEFVIISGYAEFTYAQQAVRKGVFDYCLKPIKEEKADKLLDNLLGKLKQKDKLLIKTLNKDLSSKTKCINIDNQNFKQLLEYLENNFTKDLYLKDLSKKFGFNSNYTCYLFNKYTGVTFSEYLLDLRMRKAVRLLKNQSLTIQAIAGRTGYNDYYYFNKVFKKYYGITATEYRKDYFKSLNVS